MLDANHLVWTTLFTLRVPEAFGEEMLPLFGIDNCHWPFIRFLLVKETSDYRSWDLMRVNCLSVALVLAKL